jgi:hypothetical protein
MRELKKQELVQVSGAGDCCCPAPEPHKPGKQKGNNGFGNGGQDGVPGNSNKQDRTR